MKKYVKLLKKLYYYISLPNTGAIIMRPLSIVVISKSQAAAGKTYPVLTLVNVQLRKVNAPRVAIFKLNFPNPIKTKDKKIISKQFATFLKTRLSD